MGGNLQEIRYYHEWVSKHVCLPTLPESDRRRFAWDGYYGDAEASEWQPQEGGASDVSHHLIRQSYPFIAQHLLSRNKLVDLKMGFNNRKELTAAILIVASEYFKRLDNFY
ncbi:hypothetical protein CDAR_390711 [Caerostris darwini]|uniref:Uncharacterized protein n=1 Tax=Caerostris darwini TaxID=1538125 RepID=A0AAV4RYI4_9ARAC|nr:hypothetical protein CDAR_390711 [Caerostris darwini]